MFPRLATFFTKKWLRFGFKILWAKASSLWYIHFWKKYFGQKIFYFCEKKPSNNHDLKIELDLLKQYVSQFFCWILILSIFHQLNRGKRSQKWITKSGQACCSTKFNSTSIFAVYDSIEKSILQQQSIV